MRSSSAAIVVVGNEILSGKVADTNSAFAARELRSVGVTLERIIVIPDDVEVIGPCVRSLHERFDVVITSGGVGPTHDDVTIAGVALGFGVPVVHDPLLVEAIRQFGDLTPARLKMAEVPQGAELLFGGTLRFPVVRFGKVFILPGIPEHFRDKMLALKPTLAVDPYFLRVLYLNAVESSIAPQLNTTLSAFPLLQLGSYPRLDSHDYQVRVTLESKDHDYVDRALAHLTSQLPGSIIVKVE